MHVAVNDARRLQLDALLGVDGPLHVAADNGLTAHDVALHFPAPGDEDLFRRPDRAVHRAFDFYDAVCRDVSDHAHTGADDREAGDSFACAPPAASRTWSFFRKH